MKQIDWEKIDQLVVDKYISKTKHPQLDLWILNYTHKTQFDQMWCEETEVCRGLIMDSERNIIARPFRKFFNLSQVENLPAEEFTVTEKMDGCFLYHTPLLCWDGSTVLIGDVVSNNLKPLLVGMDEHGNLVPSKVVNWFDNGTKNNWIDVFLSNRISKKSGAGNHPNRLRVTSNHHVFINGKFRAISQAVVGDIVQTYEYSPSENILHVVKSGLLGDGSLTSGHNGFRYQESHKLAHGDYIATLSKWFGTTSLKISPMTSGFGRPMLRTGVKEFEAFRALRKEWYPKGTKCVPQDLSWMDDFSVAKWYMDDGSLSHSEKQEDRACFATNGFIKKDVQRLADKLTEMYGVSCVVFDNKGWNIRVNATAAKTIDNFWRAIAPHVVPCMRYKLPKRFLLAKQIKRKVGTTLVSLKEARITKIKAISVGAKNNKEFPAGRKGFDIKTTTGNYYANGILVHNSLGILYWEGDCPAIATRGSFTSDQAVDATKILREKYPDVGFISNYTYLFEYIAPTNRIVVDYGKTRDLVLLSIIETDTGIELPFCMVKFFAVKFGLPVVKSYDGVEDYKTLLESVRDNAEGYVVRFESGLRVKIKFDEYVRLHRLLTNVNAKAIWDLLRNGQSLNELIERVPDEFYNWVKQTQWKLMQEYNEIERESTYIMNTLGGLDRKTFAENASKLKYRGILFAMLDGKDYSQIIWKMIRPEAEKPFRLELDK